MQPTRRAQSFWARAGFLTTLSFASACAGTGATSRPPVTANQASSFLDAQVVAQIKEGRTTETEVRRLLGSPGAVSSRKDVADLPPGQEVWAYSEVKDGTVHALAIIFKDGVVQQMSKSAVPIP